MLKYIDTMLSFFLMCVAIRNVWPQRMSLKAFAALYILLLLAGIPITLLSVIPYGLFGILVTVCIFGLLTCRDTAPQNVSMGMVGFILAAVTEDIVRKLLDIILPQTLSNHMYFSVGVRIIRIILFYFITLFCGKMLKKLLLSDKGIFRYKQTWYLIDAALLLVITIFSFDSLISGQNGSVGKMIYNNVLHILGYSLVMFFIFLAMRHFYLEKVKTEAKQKALQNLQEYTHNLENMYNSLRSFKHDYVNILLSMSGYIENGNIEDLKQFFENKIFPTKNLIDQGNYKLTQLSNIGVFEIKSLLSAKMIYAHESGIDVTIDIPDIVETFVIDTVDLARIFGVFLDNAIEAAMETEPKQIALNIIQNKNGVSIIISNSFNDNGEALHKLKQKGFTTKSEHQGIGLSNAQKIINSYDNVLLETTMQSSCFIQHLEIIDRKE